MSQGSQVHIFWGAPMGPLKMTVSQGATSLMSTADAWEKIQLLYSQHSLHLKAENEALKNLKDCEVLDAAGLQDLSGHFLTTCVNGAVQREDDFIYSSSETQNIKSRKSYPSGLSDMTDSVIEICGFEDRVQHLQEDYQKLHCENKKILDEQSKSQSNPCVQNFQIDSFQLDNKCAAILDLDCNTKQINVGTEVVGTKHVPTEHQERQYWKCVSFDTKYEPESEGAVRKASKLKISTDTEFLSIMTSSQLAFLAQGKDTGQDYINKEAVNMEIDPTGSHGEVRQTEDNLMKPSDDFGEGAENGQSQVYSLELFSPVCPESKNNHVHTNPEEAPKENIRSQELFSNEESPPPNEISIELCDSGILCSQLNTFHQSTAKRSRTSKGISHHSKALSEVPQVSKKLKMDSNARESGKAMEQKIVSVLTDIKRITLIKNCDSKSLKYNCLAMVLAPCHVKEINIKSGPNSGSKVPLATIIVIDQSEIKKKVVLWRTAAFWALTVFLGDIILLTDVTVHEDQWIGETVLQSTFTSQLLNLGSYSCIQPEKWEKKVLES